MTAHKLKVTWPDGGVVYEVPISDRRDLLIGKLVVRAGVLHLEHICIHDEDSIVQQTVPIVGDMNFCVEKTTE